MLYITRFGLFAKNVREVCFHPEPKQGAQGESQRGLPNLQKGHSTSRGLRKPWAASECFTNRNCTRQEMIIANQSVRSRVGVRYNGVANPFVPKRAYDRNVLSLQSTETMGAQMLCLFSLISRRTLRIHL
jgi:hypothetical protein